MNVCQYYPVARKIALNADRIKNPPPQLLKWIGNKHKQAPAITSFLPSDYNRYFEPFLGTGAVLAAMHPMFPQFGIASDVIKPLVEIMRMLQSTEGTRQLIGSYKTNWELFMPNRTRHYKRVLERYNRYPNAYDLLFIVRTCMWGIVRFTKDGILSVPMEEHRDPMHPDRFSETAPAWTKRFKYVNFAHASYKDIMGLAGEGDLVYCDPPYLGSQNRLYGAHGFLFQELVTAIEGCASRGAKVALSIDGKSPGGKTVGLDIPSELFKRKFLIYTGRSPLSRIQNGGGKVNGNPDNDRLLLTW